jgi:hypothetical protein
MGSLITETPYSEITATLEILDHHGVGRDSLRKFRAAPTDVQRCVAAILREADSVTAISTTIEKLTAKVPPILVFDDEHIASVNLDTPHSPDAFWHTTKQTPARYVYDSLRTNVVARALPSEPSGIVKVPYADVSRNTTVGDILKTPGVGDNDPSKLCHIIASMIEAQPNDEYSKDGLLNDGRANLFPCGSVLVRVHWSDDSREWHVRAWNLGNAVSVGRRVFSGNLKL